MGNWKVFGNGDYLILGISESGFPLIQGTASSHKTIIYSDPEGIFSDHQEDVKAVCKSWNALELLWTICPTNAPEIDIDPAGNGLHKRCKESPKSSHGYLDLFNKPESLGLHIALPPTTFRRAWQLFREVLLETQLNYSIGIDFRGFRVEGAASDTLTIDEFARGEPYFFDEVSFQIRRDFA